MVDRLMTADGWVGSHSSIWFVFCFDQQDHMETLPPTLTYHTK